MMTDAAERSAAARSRFVGSGVAVLQERVRPVTLTDEQRLPAAPALEAVLPGGGVRRGSVVGLEGPGSTSLLWSLLAPPTEAGSWAVLVGLPAAGLLAAADAGVALERLAVVAPPGGSWATVLGALLDGFDLVVAAPDRKVRPADARRLTARARERGTVVVLAGGGAVSAWPEGADLRLALTGPDWEGLGRGHGQLQRRRVHLEVSGRREAARPRAADLRLALTTPDWEGLGRGHGHLQRRRVHLEVSGRREAARPRAADLWLPAEADPVAAVEVPDLRVLAPDGGVMTPESGARTVRPVRVA